MSIFYNGFRHLRWYATLLVLVLIGLIEASTGGRNGAMAATSIITDIRIGTQENTTRFVFEFTKGMAVNIFTLAKS